MMLRQSLKTIPRQLRRTITTYAKQDQLFIHPKSSNKHLLSFSKNPDSLSIGEFYSKNPESPDLVINSDNFISTNPEFLKLLHQVIKDNIHDDFTYSIESNSYADEHLPVYDLRKIPNYQRQPEIEDVFGYVRVDSEGGIMNETYQINDFYKIVNVDGPLKLSEKIHEELVGQLDGG
ncbi:hypothetical protein BN7_1548 [Wickerhamomyces ciferrii]|uniref:Uncharacterized protein n=1 Tax=Wickerhamomyces ciferrii (strain ATCC 14091 / BCRC 22168 / CBS 111 / JCM 3599 / NBRC 0793 / NRRL Y-1031 F-60-10) TaxID=1206466 RepID=K0KKL6_WICCF|nr:uncharacterized protein BN7_1548 [Wickerhamomyces ciferrii]CCH42009.1 hypothetical protein BN7_1548 [Wickerhamomyces ciferrii]